MADRFTEMNGGEISVNDIIYAVPEDTGEPASVEIRGFGRDNSL